MSNQNAKAIIESLKRHNEETLSKDIYIPSIGRDVHFHPFTTKHHNMLLESTLDNPVFTGVFYQKVYEIIKELCVEKDIVDSINVFDKDAVLIQLKYHFMDGKNLEKTIEGIKTVSGFEIDNETAESGDYSFVTKVPTISDENRLYGEYMETDDYSLNPSKEDFRKILGQVYLLEVSKYIKSVEIKFNSIKLDFDEVDVVDKLEILGVMDKKTIQLITDFIQSSKDQYKPVWQSEKGEKLVVDLKFFSS